MSNKILNMYKRVTEAAMAIPVQNNAIYLDGTRRASNVLVLCPNVKQTPEYRVRVVSQAIGMGGMASIHLAQEMNKWEA